MRKILLVVTTTLTLGFTACGDSDMRPPPPLPEEDYSGIKGYLWNEAPNADVYIAGGRRIFKNGITQPIYEDGQKEIGVGSIFVSGNDVYLAGTLNGSSSGTISIRAALWKNGEMQILGDENALSNAYDVKVTNGNVYVVGCHHGETGGQRAALWINGVLHHLEDGHCAYSIFVDGDDVYVGGDTSQFGAVWKNGEIIKEFHYGGVSSGKCTSVFVSNGDVYAAVTDFIAELVDMPIFRASVWKNGVIQILGYHATVRSVFVSGEDVYVLGDEFYLDNPLATAAMLWKNGVLQRLGGLGSDERPTHASKLFVSGDDVYVTGYEVGSEGATTPLIWISGEAKNLEPFGLTNAVSVFVVEKGS
jgi:hypothetical protein